MAINLANSLNTIKSLGNIGHSIDNNVGGLNSLSGALKPFTGGEFLPNIPAMRPLSLAAKGNYLGAAANLAGGIPGEIGADIAGHAVKTAHRAYRAGLQAPNQLASATARGAVNGLVKNRRNILDVAVPGSVTIGENINKIVKKDWGHTKIGNALTTDISAPIYNKLGLRKKLKTATGGFFYMSDINIINS